MKIVLFSRCDLVHLYGKLDSKMPSEIKIIHLAYSDVEQKILENEYGIVDVINFKREVELIHENQTFKEFDAESIEKDILKFTDERFSINSAIFSDRTMKFKKYNDAMLLLRVYCAFWEGFFKKYTPKIILHEPTAVLFNHMASVYARKNDCRYLSPILSYGDFEYNFIFLSGDDSNFDEFKAINFQEDKIRATNFISNFRNNFDILAQELCVEVSLTSIIKLFFKEIAWKLFYRRKIESNKILDHVESYFYLDSKPFRKLCNTLYQRNLIDYDFVCDSDEYYYYPLHVEPEAVVLYWADGIYTNQVKLIENIAAQLPVGKYLYVKDHPHCLGYRDYLDYQRIKSVPNVKLVDHRINGKILIKNSLGVLTLNGTSGFEGLMMNKPVVTFGNAWYGNFDGVTYIKNIRDLKSEILKLNPSKKLTSDVSRYLDSVHEGFVNYFGEQVKKSGVDEEINTVAIVKALLKYMERMEIEK